MTTLVQPEYVDHPAPTGMRFFYDARLNRWMLKSGEHNYCMNNWAYVDLSEDAGHALTPEEICLILLQFRESIIGALDEGRHFYVALVPSNFERQHVRC